jgi:hypothetical protein
MAQLSPVEAVYLGGVAVAFAAFIVTLFTVSIRTTLALSKAAAKTAAPAAGARLAAAE